MRYSGEFLANPSFTRRHTDRFLSEAHGTRSAQSTLSSPLHLPANGPKLSTPMSTVGETLVRPSSPPPVPVNQHPPGFIPECRANTKAYAYSHLLQNYTTHYIFNVVGTFKGEATGCLSSATSQRNTGREQRSSAFPPTTSIKL